MKKKTIDLLARILLHHELISAIHFPKPLPALEKLNAEIVQHIRDPKRPTRPTRPTNSLYSPKKGKENLK